MVAGYAFGALRLHGVASQECCMMLRLATYLWNGLDRLYRSHRAFERDLLQRASVPIVSYGMTGCMTGFGLFPGDDHATGGERDQKTQTCLARNMSWLIKVPAVAL